MTDRLLPRRLSVLDATFLYAETDEAPLHIAGVDVLDGDVSAAMVIARLEARLREVPRYTQRVAPAPLGLGHPVWEDDPRFDVRRHVQETHLEPPGNQRALESCAARLFAGRLDRRRPLWEIHVIGGLEGGHSAVLTKIHHCMVDGVSGIELLKILFDLGPDGSPFPGGPTAATVPPAGTATLVLEALRGAASEVADTAAGIARSLTALPETWRAALQRTVEATMALAGSAVTPVARLPFNRPLSGARRLGWLTLPVDRLKAIARHRHGTVNDVALAILADGIGRMLARSGVDVGSQWLRILVPVNVRREHEGGRLGNRVSMIPVEVPLAAAPLGRLDCTIARTAAMKRAGLADLVDLACQAGELVPASLHATAMSLAASATLLTWSAPLRSAPFLVANMVCTNVPGPPVPIYGFGHRVLAHYPIVPLGFETGLNCALVTYNQALHVGLVADAAAIDDLAPLAGDIRAAFDDLSHAAGVAGPGD